MPSLVDINYTLVAQIVNFLILVVVVSWFAYKPIMKIMDERQSKIATDLKNAEDTKIEAQNVKKEYERQLTEARSEAQAIIDKANKTAKEAYDQMLAQAREEQENIFKTAKEQIEREKANALLEVRGEVVSLSMQLASKVIAKKIDEQADKKIIDDFLDEITNKTGGLPC